MTKRHALINRTALRGLAAVIALGCFQVAIAADLPVPYNSVEYKNYSKAFGWSPLTGSTPGGGGVQFQQAGATDVTAKPDTLKLTQSGKTVNVNAGVKMPLGAGKTVPIIAKAAVTGAMYARGVQAMLGGPLGITLVALPLLMNWVDSLGDHRVNRQSGEVEKLVEGTEVDTWCEANPAGWSDFVAGKNRSNADFTDTATSYSFVTPNDQCWYGAKVRTVMAYGAIFNEEASYIIMAKLSVPRNTAKWIPYSMGQTASAFDRPNAPALTPEILNEGVSKGNVDPFISTPPQYVTSGPGSVAGPTTSTTSQTRVETGTTREASPGSTVATDPATKTTTTTTNHTVNYNGDKVTHNTTTTSVTNITNNTTGTTEKVGEEVTEKEGESPKEKEDQPDLCEKNPDILACAKPDLDTPELEIPKSEKTLTYTEEDSFGGGNCPSDLYTTVNGQSIKAYDWQQTCGIVNFYLRPLILLLGAMGALFILIPGRDS